MHASPASSSLRPARPAAARTRPLAALAALRDLSRDPNRLDRVLDLGIALNARAFPRIWARFARDADGARVLAQRPSIDSHHVDLAALARLPDGTLGREYARFLETNRITPDVFTPPPLADRDAAYLAQRIRQTHDLWHVLTGYAPDVEGEVLLQAFTFGQIGTPSSFLIGALGGLRVAAKKPRPRVLRRVLAAYGDGRRARFFAGTYWEEHWAEPVDALRDRFGVRAPRIDSRRAA